MADTIPINILLNATAKLDALKTLEDQTEKFGMRLRLTGRDLMRLGGTIDRFFSGIWSQWTGFLGLSDDWAVGMEDISWAFEDVAAVIGGTLAPSLEVIATLVESLADFLEDNPWAVWLITAGALVIVFGMLLGKFMTLWGTLTLISGTMMVARKESLSFGQTLTYLRIAMTEGAAEAQLYISSLGKLKNTFGETEEAIKEEVMRLEARNKIIPQEIANEQKRISQLQGSKKQTQAVTEEIAKHQGNVAALNEELNSNTFKISQGGAALDKMQKKEKKPVTFTEKLKDAFSGAGQKGKALVPTIAKIGGAIGLIGGVGGLFLTQWEPLSDLFETLTELFIDLMSPLEGIIYWISDWIEENPELAKWILAIVLILGTLVFLMGKFGGVAKIAGGITNFLGGAFSNLAGGAKAFGKNQLASVAALALLVASIAVLVFAFSQLFNVFKEMGMGGAEGLGVIVGLFATILGFLFGLFKIVDVMGSMGKNTWKGIAALAALVAVISLLAVALGFAVQMIAGTENGLAILTGLVVGIVALMVTVTALAIAIMPAQPVLWLFVAVLLALGLVVLMVGAGVMFLGLGVKFLADAFVTVLNTLLANLDVLPKLIPLAFALGAALFAAGTGGLTAMVGLMGAAAGWLAVSVGIFATSIALFALAASITAVAAAMSLVPEWGRGILGGVIGGLGAIGGAITGFFGGLMGAQRGGIVSEEGLVYLHAGEVVTPAGGTSMSKYDNTFFINVTVRSDEDVKSLVEQINRYQSAKIGRTV